ncbi:hypothetical protein J4218_06130 [Candidatus Pacearchaeota archaeon]|nr:hypothetical protein [Candidatus Pacearchaeota archaeon]
MVLIWDTSRSTLVEETIDQIAQKIASGEISPEISPNVLVNELGGDFARFYFASFRRVDRSRWAQERFPASETDPSGFEAFVEELRRKVNNLNIRSNKRLVPLYVSHTDDEIGRIMTFSQMYKTGELTKEEAVEGLEKDFDIRMSDSRADFYFPRTNRTPLNKLISRLNQARKQRETDLSNIDCVKGLLFENLVGVYLVEKNGSDNVESQVRRPVTYRDLSGTPHREVFLDFLVDGENVEVKLRNALENILDSVLPQNFALERERGASVKSTVICRSRNPELDALYTENVSLAEEASKMGIDEVGRKIQSVFDYVDFETEIEGSSRPQLYERALAVLDSLTEENASRAKSYTRALSRIQDNPEGLLAKLGILVKKMEEQAELDQEDLDLLFGPSGNRRSSRVDVERRIEIIRKSEDKKKIRILIEMYNLRHQSSETDISEEVIADLESLQKPDFNSLYRSLVDSKAGSRKRRKSKPNGVDDILGFHQRAYERRSRECLAHAKSLYKRFDNELADTSNRVMKDMGLEDNLAHVRTDEQVLLRYLSRLPELKGVDVGKCLGEAMAGSSCYFDKVYNYFQALANDSGMNNILSLGRQGLASKMFNKMLDALVEDVDGFKEKVNSDESLEGNPVVGKLRELKKSIDERKLSASKTERTAIMLANGIISNRIEDIALDSYKTYLGFLREASEVHSYLAQENILHFLNFVRGRLRPLQNQSRNLGGTLLDKLSSGQSLVESIVCSFNGSLNNQMFYYQMRDYCWDNIEDMLDNEESQKKFILKLKEIVLTTEESRHLPGAPYIFQEAMLNYSGIITSIKDMDDVRKLSLIEDCAKGVEADSILMGGRVALDLYDFIQKFVGGRETGMRAEERFDRAARMAPKVFGEMASGTCLQRLMLGDYYARRAYNTRVLARVNPQYAVKYFHDNYVFPNELNKPLREFAREIKEFERSDQELFRKYLLNGSNGNGNGNGNSNGNRNVDHSINGEYRNRFYQACNRLGSYVGNVFKRISGMRNGGRK